MCVPRRSYGTGPLLTFRFRFRRESLPTREAGLQRVPPAEAVLAALPAQVRDLGSDARGEVDKAAAHVLEFASESVNLVYSRLDGTLEIGLLGKRIRVRIAVLRGRGDEAIAQYDSASSIRSLSSRNRASVGSIRRERCSSRGMRAFASVTVKKRTGASECMRRSAGPPIAILESSIAVAGDYPLPRSGGARSGPPVPPPPCSGASPGLPRR